MRLRGPALLLLVAITGCGGEDNPNPFAGVNATVPPPAGAVLLFTSGAWSTTAGAPRELFSTNADGSVVTRLTFCNSGERVCDTVEAAPAPDRTRMAVRRTSQDADGDGRLTAADGVALVFVALDRSTEAEIQPAARQVNGVDWTSSGDLLFYAMAGPNGSSDLFRSAINGTSLTNFTQTDAIEERRPRIDPAVTLAVIERSEPGVKSRIFLFQSTTSLAGITTGGEGSEALPGTPYVVGSDADPAFSPDGRSAAFRRLTGVGNGGLGTWDVLTVPADGSVVAPTPIASGPVFRGAPDWGPSGIVFTETDAAAGTAALVVVQPDGSGRHVILTQDASFNLGFPRWLPAAR